MNITKHKHYEPHTENATGHMNWLRASVLGVNDGLVSLAALLVGVAGASASSGTLLITGIAGLLAGACSMAAGEYVSVSSQRDSEHALLEKERYELEHYPDEELEELVMLYEKKGLKPETARVVANELTARDAFAAHVDAELNLDPDELTNPLEAAVASAISFSIGALVPILTIALSPAASRIPITFVGVIIALVITGIFSARISGVRVLPVIIRVLVGGIAAMAITFGIGHLFGAHVG